MKNRILRLLKYSHRFGFFKGLKLYFLINVLKRETFTLPGGTKLKLRSGTSDADVFEQVFLENQYDFPNLGQINSIIDAGSNIGASAVFFKRKYPSSKVICIEPNMENFTLLKINTGTFNNVQLYQNALWSENKYLNMVSSYSADSHYVKDDIADAENKIEGITIQDLMIEHGFEVIDILKMDIEGAEKEIFSQNYQLWLPKVRYLMIELHDRMKKGCSKSVFKAISEQNFSVEFKGEILLFRNDKMMH